ncbi:nucleotide sugar dehydrogenase [Thiohalocapsa marina]|uniref:Nucleotide sugar dehydrogenase n=1 Tax=Thiohalocapsa marina TaxID=424902 RepID=A0A5M8FV51_9GAMM|nr:nucleotide sugar dehydrogenase [Thiohalocapsa marina]KAA6187694.1 nucleotide sugar dehydrogenase [Thiohalocapsa marina]
MTTRFPETPSIAIIGLGYVGLPLAVEFGRLLPTIGFDIDARRIRELTDGLDRTREVEAEELAAATQLRYTTNLDDVRHCSVFIVTVPTPIDDSRNPDLTPLLRASETVGQVLKPGDIVIYESTVFPGCTEEVCVPLLERLSGLRYLSGEAGDRVMDTTVAATGAAADTADSGGFYCGYSPERINPGDKTHRLPDIRKVTSGSTPLAADYVDSLYRRIIRAGTHKASSLRVAEAAKVIENTQRDVNIALINELALIFNRLGIDTEEVLQAAGTKWNFLPFRPGLVGGHCIGVDPYYLTHKAQQVGLHPEMILSGRRTNDGMGRYVAGQLVKAMLRKRIQVEGARALVLGLTFKENCPDLRNTRVVDILAELADYHIAVDVHDPWVDPDEAEAEYDVRPVADPEPGAYDAIVLAVAHREFAEQGADWVRGFGRASSVVYDLKYVLPAEAVDLRL